MESEQDECLMMAAETNGQEQSGQTAVNSDLYFHWLLMINQHLMVDPSLFQMLCFHVTPTTGKGLAFLCYSLFDDRY